MKENRKDYLFGKILETEKSAFFIDLDHFGSNISRMYHSFQEFYPKIAIGYSYKTNYVPDVCRMAHKLGCWAEVVSEMEVDMALANTNEFDPAQIIFNGPVKTEDSIKKVVLVGGIINVDNESDIEKVERVCNDYLGTQERAKVAFRLNFSYLDQSSRFGMDMVELKNVVERAKQNEKIEIVGFHLHLPFRTVQSFQFRIDCIVSVLETFSDIQISYINIGGGFLGTITADLAKALNITAPPDFRDYARVIGQKLTEFYSQMPLDKKPTLFIEPGSSLIADPVYFLSRIHTVKCIESRNIIVTYAGRHLISPTNKTISLPLSVRQFNDSGCEQNPNTSEEIYQISGYTCIESDILGTAQLACNVSPSTTYVVINNAGSYSVVMGSNFILPEPAIFVFSEVDGIRLARKSKSAKEIIASFQ